MNRLPGFAAWASVALAVAFCVAVSQQKLIPIIPTVNAAVTGAQDQGQDPAAVNMAPSGPSYTTETQPPPDQGNAAPGQYPDDSGYGEQPIQTAMEPPPALPDYQQPPPPGDGYLWQPGYWAWAPSGGYYWVPGAWVEPPYMGALWTPGYWGFYGGRYRFYPGHWGMHIGFYGGINYGFGYLGFGYEGGYWNSNHFYYNRVYNNIDARRVHNVYSFRSDNQRGGYRGGDNNQRPSYRGGAGGVQASPRQSEGAAWREPTSPRMNTQEQHAQKYQSNRRQFANVNHGNPPQAAVRKPITADRNVHPTVQAHDQAAPNRGGNRNQQHR
jgi:WXXGXW repeat (2 copies)